MNTRSSASFLIVQLEETHAMPEQVARLRAALQCELAHVARRTSEPAKPEFKSNLMLEYRSERKKLSRRTHSKLRSAARLGLPAPAMSGACCAVS